MTTTVRTERKLRKTGVDWLPEIPENWDLISTRWLFSQANRKGFESEPLLSVTQTQGVIRRDELADRVWNPAGGTSGYKLVTEGDFVISLRSFEGGLERSTIRGLVSPAYTVLEPRKPFNPGFMRWFMKSPVFISALNLVTSGIRQGKNISFEDFALLYAPIPPQDEQARIGAFLDHETSKIDALIAKQERLLELAVEKRLSETFRLATKGLDPSPDLRPSGVTWIGDTPAHWKTAKLRHVATLESGHTPSRQKPEYWENCTIPWVSLADVGPLRSGRKIYLRDTKEKISELGMANSSARLLPEKTVVLSRTASVGFSAILAKPMATTQDFAAWICGDTIHPEYLYCVLQAMKPEYDRLMMGSTHQTIYMPDIREFVTPLPPIEEQRAIASRVLEIRQTIATTQDRISTSIDLLKERRTSLITSATTGQLDLRDWTPPG